MTIMQMLDGWLEIFKTHQHTFYDV